MKDSNRETSKLQASQSTCSFETNHPKEGEEKKWGKKIKSKQDKKKKQTNKQCSSQHKMRRGSKVFDSTKEGSRFSTRRNDLWKRCGVLREVCLVVKKKREGTQTNKEKQKNVVSSRHRDAHWNCGSER
jgi:hypothetical protein